MATKYPHGVRCIDCSEPLTDEEIFRRPVCASMELRHFSLEETVLELVCFQCLLRPSSQQETIQE